MGFFNNIMTAAKDFGGHVTGLSDLAEQRAAREAAAAERERQAKAFEAIQGGDVLGAAAYAPDIASQYQNVAAGEDQRSTAQDALRRQAGLRATRAVKTLAPKFGGDYGAAFDFVAEKSGGLFGSPEELASAREFVIQNGDQGLAAIEAGFTEPAAPKSPYLNTSNGVFDTERGVIVEGTGKQTNPLDDEYKRSQIEANRALAEQRRSKDGPSASPAANLTEGQKARDRQYGKEVVGFLNTDAPTAAANIARLRDAVDIINNNDVSGPIAGAGTAAIRSITNPKSAAVQQQIETAVQSSLKATLGAQFAKVEGENLLARAFDPRQQEAENARRVNLLANAIEDQYSRKVDAATYFQENGTLNGYGGGFPDPNVFYNLLKQWDDEEGAAKAVKEEDDLVAKYLKK